MKTIVVACATAALALVAAAADAQVKIGFLAELSGPQGALGQDMYDGFMLGIEHAGGTLGGHAVEVIKEDSQLKPDVGIQIIQKFVQRDRVDVVTGVTFSNVMMAVARPLADAGMIFVGSNAGPAPLAGAQCSRNFFFTSWQNDMQAEVMGKYAVDRGYRRVYLMAPNYQAGKDFIAGFKRFYRGEIVDEVYTQLGQLDYSAEIAQLATATPDSAYVFYPGGMGVNFVKQYKQAGLMGKIPLLSTSTTDGSTLPGLGLTAVGVLSGSFWGPDFDNAVSRKFVADFERKHNRVPSQYAAQAYDAARLLDAAVRKAGGAKDRDRLRAALRAADFKSVRGAFRFNVNGFPIQDMHVFEVVPDARWTVNLRTVATPLRDHKDGYYTQCPHK
jgi:branched-chain amino acid transport system substrate-binding protein